MKFISLITVLTLSATLGFGQILQGKVVDVNKRPIEGVNIIIARTGRHVHSGPSGQFIINAIQKGDSLLISHIGYESQGLLIEDYSQLLVIRLEEAFITLAAIAVSPEIDAINLFADVNIQTNPVNNSQEILRRVPGLVIGQHAGGGKAEQIFLRGFDVDHGTDINITVDGLPVNMVSHAHGQGYADLHFVIPESIERLNFGKGPYYADHGNFTTAGYIDFEQKEKLDNSLIKLEIGQFNTQRLLGMFNLLNNENNAAYMGAEYILSDGPFESPQNFRRFNVMGKFVANLASLDKLIFTASYFASKWDASGQVPQRAVDDGSISRFGAIDDTEGGNTDRMNLVLNYIKTIDQNSIIENNFYYSKYDFDLYSNFTFYLHDSINGDQIRQKENRQLFGLSSVYNRFFHAAKTDGTWQAGFGFRADQSNNNELSHTVSRVTTLDTIRLGDINETNFYAFANLNLSYKKWSFNPSLRLDYFIFNYNNKMLGYYKPYTVNDAIFSPKLNILYNFSRRLQVYLKGGKGFHSNDARVGLDQNVNEMLSAAYGADLGFIWKPGGKVIINTAAWYLFLEQEYVYVGDEGIIEPVGSTKRAGVDFSIRYQPLFWLYADADINYAYARIADAPEGDNYIPLAPDLTVQGGLNVVHPDGYHASLRVRYLKDRPATADYSFVARGYTIFDLNGGYHWRNIELIGAVQNLFNIAWNETQFATVTRLQEEPAPVEDITFTPGTPFFFKASLAYRL